MICSFEVLSTEFDILVTELLYVGVMYGMRWHALKYCRAFLLGSQIGRWKHPISATILLPPAACVVEQNLTPLIAIWRMWFSSSTFFPQSLTPLWLNNYLYIPGVMCGMVWVPGKWWHALKLRSFSFSSQVGRWKHPNSATVLSSAACVVEQTFIYTIATWFAPFDILSTEFDILVAEL